VALNEVSIHDRVDKLILEETVHARHRVGAEVAGDSFVMLRNLRFELVDANEHHVDLRIGCCGQGDEH